MAFISQPNPHPPNEWGLDPLFWTSAKLFIADLLTALPSGSASVFFVGNQRIVRSVEVVGIIVSVDTHSPRMTMYNVDDGTGVIPCVQFIAADDQLPYDLGTTVCIEGRLATFRSIRQVVIRSIKAIDANQEVYGWLQRLSLRPFLQKSLIKR